MRPRTTLLAMMLACTLMIQAQISKVNVTIDGPGVVDEYLTLNTDGTKQLKLKAVPSKFLGNVTFDGWSGDATDTNEELIVSPDKAQNIRATFTYHGPTKQYPLLNLKQSWADMGKPMYIEMPKMPESESMYAWRGHCYLPVDYNRDGYLDYIHFPMKGGMGTDNHRENVRFLLGKPDGTFEEDPKNDNRLVGTVYSIHVKYADFNDDGYPDFCSFSTGYDRNGSTGDYPVILMSSPDGVYTDLRFTDYSNGCYHGGEVGDIDNDGDIDIIFWDIFDAGKGTHSLVLINDGRGNFTKMNASEIIDFSDIRKDFPSPDKGMNYGDLNIIDLNNDGYNDICFTGYDIFNPDGSNYICAPMVLWGNSSGKFGGTNYSRFPKCRLGYAICEDLLFYDLNGDGVKEVILERNGDGELGGTRFYKGGYLQVCEWDGTKFVDKTDMYIPVENTAYNKEKGETCLWVENFDGTDYIYAAWGDNNDYVGVGVGQSRIYAIRHGILEPVEGYTETKVPSFDEGLPLYVDGVPLADLFSCHDGINPTDTMSEHQWVGISDWDATGGNMYRINRYHRQDTHFGRTCIRWNRDGQDPTKELEKQNMTFGFVSGIDIKKLADNGYCLEFFIKNTDPKLTLRADFTNHDNHYTPKSFASLSATISSRHVEGGKFTGEWQRVLIPLSAFNGNGDFSQFVDFSIYVEEGDLNNEFYLDDIRIRRFADSGMDDYERAFVMNYLSGGYLNKERTAQVKSQEFKAMLKSLIGKFAPDSMSYFNNYITDYEVPLTRGMATCMAYYTARCIGAETGNGRFGATPEDMWELDSRNYNDLLPHWNDRPETDYPEGMYWRGDPFSNWQAGWWWNVFHVSDKSGLNVIALDKTVNSFHMNDALTWEDAIRAITRLYDSLDPELVATGISSQKVYPVTAKGSVYYNLNGQRVSHTVKGVYIQDGSKIIVK